MKVYCCDTECPNKAKVTSICTCLMDVTDCPKRKNEKTKK
jgi:hypothetical protein